MDRHRTSVIILVPIKALRKDRSVLVLFRAWRFSNWTTMTVVYIIETKQRLVVTCLRIDSQHRLCHNVMLSIFLLLFWKYPSLEGKRQILSCASPSFPFFSSIPFIRFSPFHPRSFLFPSFRLGFRIETAHADISIWKSSANIWLLSNDAWK